MKEEKARDTDRVTYRVQQHKDSEQMHSVTVSQPTFSPSPVFLLTVELGVWCDCLVGVTLNLEYFWPGQGWGAAWTGQWLPSTWPVCSTQCSITLSILTRYLPYPRPPSLTLTLTPTLLVYNLIAFVASGIFTSRLQLRVNPGWIIRIKIITSSNFLHLFSLYIIINGHDHSCLRFLVCFASELKCVRISQPGWCIILLWEQIKLQWCVNIHKNRRLKNSHKNN